MKLLFVHEVSYTKKVIFEMHEFPELLSLRGHEVTFLEFDEGRKFWSKKSREDRTVLPGRVHPATKIKLARPFQLGVPGLDRLLAVFTVVPKLKRLLRKTDFDAVVLYAVPTFGPQTIKACRKAGKPVLFRALDVSHKIRSSIFSPLIKAAERYVYKHATLVSANNQAIADYCVHLSSRTAATAVHFPPLDLPHFKPIARDAALAEKLGLAASDRVILYMGSFFYFSGLVQAIEEFAKSKREGLKLLLVGGGEQASELKQRVADLGIEADVMFTGFVPYAELPRYFSLANAAINTLEPTLVANVALPNKVLQYLAAGLPVFSTDLAGLRSTLGESTNIRWASSPAGVMAAACTYLNGQGVSDSSMAPATSDVLREFSAERAVSAFENSLVKISKGHE